MEFNLFAMPPSTIILLLSAAFGITSALPWAGPVPTSAYKADEWTPRPTDIPINPKELFRRSAVDITVCGWLGGKQDDPAVCNTGSSCIHDYAHGYVGCCTTAGKCTAGVYTACIDKNSPGGNSGPPVENNGIFTCQGDAACYKNSYPGGYSQWACGKTEQATTVETSYTGQPADVLLQLVYTRMTFSPVTLPSTTSSSSSTQTSAATTTTDEKDAKKSKPTEASKTVNPDPNAASASPGTSQTTSVVADDSAKSKNKVNGGIVAAGVIGAGAFIIALGAIILFFLRRRQKKQDDTKGGGSFMSIKGGEIGVVGAQGPPSPASTQATFPRAVAYSPDDFRTVASTTGTSPPMDPARSVYSPTEYQGIEQRMRENADLTVPPQPYYKSPSIGEDGLPRVSEIDNFSHSFHAAIARMSPPTPPQAQMSNISPPSSRGLTSHGPEGAEGIAMGAIAGGAARRESRSHDHGDGYAPVEDDDYGPQDSYMPGDDYGPLTGGYGPPGEYDDHVEEEDYGPVDQYDPINKEMGMATAVKAPPSYNPVAGFRSENVRREGWEPPELRPNRELTPPRAVERVNDATPRYQLVDQPPAGSVPVLRSAGLKGQHKGARKNQGYDGKNGDDLQA